MPRRFRVSSERDTGACCHREAERPLRGESESQFSCCQARQPSDASPVSVDKLYIIEDTGMRLKYNCRELFALEAGSRLLPECEIRPPRLQPADSCLRDSRDWPMVQF